MKYLYFLFKDELLTYCKEILMNQPVSKYIAGTFIQIIYSLRKNYLFERRKIIPLTSLQLFLKRKAKASVQLSLKTFVFYMRHLIHYSILVNVLLSYHRIW